LARFWGEMPFLTSLAERSMGPGWVPVTALGAAAWGVVNGAEEAAPGVVVSLFYG
jgi:hypothetical protein